MPSTATAPRAYRLALQDLADRAREACELACLLDYFAAQLRGARPDPEGPPPELCPSGARVRQALARLDGPLDRAREAYDALPPDAREDLPPPGDVIEAG